MATRNLGKVKNLFEFACKTLRGENVDLNQLKGKVILVENVASMWGTTTRDFTQMNELSSQFGQKLVILGFPCNQFGHQVTSFLISFQYIFDHILKLKVKQIRI